MKTQRIEYLVSAVEPEQWPVQDRPEIVLVGRSNAGKSSLINAMWRRPVAFVSSKPGKTTVLNFYNVGDSYRVVDSPGYGYARKASELQAGFRGIEVYLNARQTLKGLLIIIDSKRSVEPEEKWLIDFCRKNKVPVVAVLNKCDKLNQKERGAQKKVWSAVKIPVFMVSAQEKIGVDELENWVFDNWVKPAVRAFKEYE